MGINRFFAILFCVLEVIMSSILCASLLISFELFLIFFTIYGLSPYSSMVTSFISCLLPTLILTDESVTIFDTPSNAPYGPTGLCA